MTVFYDPAELRRHRARLKKQREYQEAYRGRLKAGAIPDRDDIAGAVLGAFLDQMAVDYRVCGPLPVAMMDRLQVAGFDRKRSMERIRAMVIKARRRLASTPLEPV